MKTIEQDEMLSMLGYEKALELCGRFGNQRIPGKRFRNRVNKQRFLAEYDGKDIQTYARKYDVTTQTLNNWRKGKTL